MKKIILLAMFIATVSPTLAQEASGESEKKPVKGWLYNEYSLLSRQTQSSVNGQFQSSRFFGFGLEFGMYNIEGLPTWMTFGLGVNTNQEIVHEIVGYDWYGQAIMMSDFLERRSDYRFLLGGTFGKMRIAGIVGAETRGHTRFFLDHGDRLEEVLPFELIGVPPDFIVWRNDLFSNMQLGLLVNVISKKVFARGEVLYNTREWSEPILGRLDLTFRPNNWFGIGGSALYDFPQGKEFGAHLSLGMGSDVLSMGWIALRIGPSYNPDPMHGIGFRGALIISLDHHHKTEESSEKASNNNGSFRSF